MAKATKKRGRPLKLTDELIEQLASAVRVTMYVETAVQAAGIHKDTFYEWLKTAARAREKLANGTAKSKLTDKEKLCIRFSDRMKEAQAEGEQADNALVIRAAQNGAWQAAAWRLERRHPEKYGRRDHVTHAGDADKPLKAEVRIIDYSDALRAADEAKAERE